MTNRRDLIIWAAGFFDGEGCVTIKRDYRKYKDKLYLNYHLIVTLNHKSREALDQLHSLFGGNIVAFKLKGNLYWRLTLHSANVANALQEILPYVLVKRPVIEACLRFDEELRQAYKTYGNKGYPRAVTESRELHYQQVKLLNARSKPVEGAPNLEYIGSVPETVQ